MAATAAAAALRGGARCGCRRHLRRSRRAQQAASRHAACHAARKRATASDKTGLQAGRPQGKAPTLASAPLRTRCTSHCAQPGLSSRLRYDALRRATQRRPRPRIRSQGVDSVAFAALAGRTQRAALFTDVCNVGCAACSALRSCRATRSLAESSTFARRRLFLRACAACCAQDAAARGKTSNVQLNSTVCHVLGCTAPVRLAACVVRPLHACTRAGTYTVYAAHPRSLHSATTAVSSSRKMKKKQHAQGNRRATKPAAVDAALARTCAPRNARLLWVLRTRYRRAMVTRRILAARRTLRLGKIEKRKRRTEVQRLVPFWFDKNGDPVGPAIKSQFELVDQVSLPRALHTAALAVNCGFQMRGLCPGLIS